MDPGVDRPVRGSGGGAQATGTGSIGMTFVMRMRMRMAMGMLGVIGLAALAFGCSAPEPKGDLLHIQDDQFTIGNLSKEKAWATGIGCGGSERDAIANAQEIAEFNLRNLTGAARYRVQYRVLRKVPTKGQACVEVEAQAMSLRSR